MEMSELHDFWAVIPAGGAGSRLWPLSRSGAPKFLHDLTGSGRTLLQQTVDRLAPLAGDRVLVVSGASHREAVTRQLPDLMASHLVTEPSPRGTMPAIGLAAAIVEAQDPDAVIGSFAADHVIGDVESFRATVVDAVAAARAGRVVTIGIEPTFPATGFGYIRLGDRAALPGTDAAYEVERFVEKPDISTATAFLETGRYRWNAGMFVVKASVLLDELALGYPELAAGLRALAADPSRVAELWPTLEPCVIDRAVAEPAADRGRVVVVPGRFDWDDVGDFDSLAGLLGAAGELRALGDATDVVGQSASGLVVASGGRTVAVVGLTDVVVVDTPDAVLVTSRAHAQQVKEVVEALRASGREHLL